MTISVAIIMKNEESVIQRCLDCVSLFADEIVVYDTGSTDRSKEIVGKHPKARLFDSEFFDKDTHISDFEFGVAKNEPIRKCTGGWVIWWDADDFIDEENAKKIREIAENERRVSLYSFTVTYGGMTFEHCRMFSNGHKIFFDEDHACHEYLNTLGNPHFQRRDVIIQHLPGKKGIPSAERNVAILEKDYFQRGRNDQRTLFYLASAYRETGRFEDGVEFYDKYLEISA